MIPLSLSCGIMPFLMSASRCLPAVRSSGRTVTSFASMSDKSAFSVLSMMSFLRRLSRTTSWALSSSLSLPCAARSQLLPLFSLHLLLTAEARKRQSCLLESSGAETGLPAASRRFQSCPFCMSSGRIMPQEASLSAGMVRRLKTSTCPPMRPASLSMSLCSSADACADE